MFSRIILSLGCPAGIGPDIAIQVAQQALPFELVVVADEKLLRDRASLLNLPLTLVDFNASHRTKHEAKKLTVIHQALDATCEAGKPNPQFAKYTIACLRIAAQKCLDGEFDALVTGPINKHMITAGGIPFTGHTEFLADFTNTPEVVMMLVENNLRVALVTTHIPLNEVAAHITKERVEKSLQILQNALQTQFKIANPRILVAGLNPHAGEGGDLGREEIDILIPVISKLNAQGFNIQGPLPADTLFTSKYLNHCDAVLTMYHDQGLPVLKSKGFGDAVNITLGLPILRTSVDHGTAYDLAGTGKANPSSLLRALEMAAMQQ